MTRIDTPRIVMSETFGLRWSRLAAEEYIVKPYIVLLWGLSVEDDEKYLRASLTCSARSPDYAKVTDVVSKECLKQFRKHQLVYGPSPDR
jgi:hypothetical protein